MPKFLYLMTVNADQTLVIGKIKSLNERVWKPNKNAKLFLAYDVSGKRENQLWPVSRSLISYPIIKIMKIIIGGEFILVILIWSYRKI